MANIVVGTAAVAVPYAGDNILVIQNLGPGALYVDAAATVTSTTGLKLAVNAVYEFPRQLNKGSGEVWVIADAASTDVRILEV